MFPQVSSWVQQSEASAQEVACVVNIIETQHCVFWYMDAVGLHDVLLTHFFTQA